MSITIKVKASKDFYIQLIGRVPPPDDSYDYTPSWTPNGEPAPKNDDILPNGPPVTLRSSSPSTTPRNDEDDGKYEPSYFRLETPTAIHPTPVILPSIPVSFSWSAVTMSSLFLGFLSYTVLFVSPRLPITIEGETYSISDSDLLQQFSVDTALLLEGTLDIPRLTRALEDTLSYFPLFCGKLVRESWKWGIRLVNRPIELEIVETSDFGLLPEDTVLQDSWHFSPPLNMGAIMACKDVPLIRMRITLFQTNPPVSILGASSAHLAGDGLFTLRFWRLLSQNYQSLPPLDPYPTYERVAIDENCFQDGYEERFYNMFPQLAVRNAKSPPLTHKATLFFSIAQLHILHEKLSAREPPETTLRLSLQDCVSALVTVALSKANPNNGAINQIVNVFNLRGSLLPMEEPLNALSWVNATTPDPCDVIQTAFAVRKAFIEARDPPFQTRCLVAIRQLLRKAAVEAGVFDFTPPAGNLVLNSSWKFDCTSAHFGFGEDKTHFLHTILKAPRYAKMFRRNPPMPLDKSGRRTTARHADGIEFTFYLLPEDRTTFLSCLQRQWKDLGMQGVIEIMPNPELDGMNTW